MTLTIELAPDIESRLESEAAQRSMDASEYAKHLIEEALPAAPKNGAELVSYWKREGLIGTRPDITDAAAHARELRKRAETRSRG